MSGNTWIGQTIAGYHLERLLGTGASGLTFKATKDEMSFAFKILPLDYAIVDAGATKSFESEAKILANLSHPNIVPFVETGTFNEMPYIVTSYKGGMNLRDFLKEHGNQLNIQDTIAMFSQIADAIDYAHSKGIIHRDIKPENIVLGLKTDGNIVPYVTDFGVSSIREASKTSRTGSIAGSYHYMAPEIWNRGNKTQSIDIYALGVMIYEIFEGHPPFDGNEVEVMKKHIMDSPPYPTKTGDNYGHLVSQTILKALEKKPNKRFKTANEFINTISDAYVKSDHNHIQYSLQRLGIIVAAIATITAAVIGIVPGLISFTSNQHVSPTSIPSTQIPIIITQPPLVITVLATLEPTTIPAPTIRAVDSLPPTVQQTISFTVMTRLTPTQAAEIVDIYINQQHMGRLYADSSTGSDSLQISLDRPGVYNVEIKSTTRALSNTGLLLDYPGYGYGQLYVEDGDQFEFVITNPSLNPIVVWLQPY